MGAVHGRGRHNRDLSGPTGELPMKIRFVVIGLGLWMLAAYAFSQTYVTKTTNFSQTFLAPVTFTNSDLLLLGSSTGTTTFTSGNASATNYTHTFQASTGTIPLFTGTPVNSDCVNWSVSAGVYTLGDAGSACGGGGSTGANPTGTVGLSAVNGSATTFLRSDGAPPLSQAIAPTWTLAHTYTPTQAANT